MEAFSSATAIVNGGFAIADLVEVVAATCVASSAELRDYFYTSALAPLDLITEHVAVVDRGVAVAGEVQLRGLAAAERGQECYVDVVVLILVDGDSSSVGGFEERNENELQRE
ncbi:hypothetical protein DEO72_LG6g444 [Vigna unguiculata]|uniref:Uncharacterized protein n=1 Tax=Vigna unguiculata TaxID=3917 RepID=A0A4D6M353_VIGUN|nr:hypothetical protein DEO72_LG6g444 [Vigna unguiculata]